MLVRTFLTSDGGVAAGAVRDSRAPRPSRRPGDGSALEGARRCRAPARRAGAEVLETTTSAPARARDQRGTVKSSRARAGPAKRSGAQRDRGSRESRSRDADEGRPAPHRGGRRRARRAAPRHAAARRARAAAPRAPADLGRATAGADRPRRRTWHSDAGEDREARRQRGAPRATTRSSGMRTLTGTHISAHATSDAPRDGTGRATPRDAITDGGRQAVQRSGTPRDPRRSSATTAVTHVEARARASRSAISGRRAGRTSRSDGNGG